ncbi:MAG TPA: T9SS type A sorting domain-containing protein [Saprospiraceae bacterium]|nr:T9SS type A sorting domain-containing protein [Saprospiraceae bacterium]
MNRFLSLALLLCLSADISLAQDYQTCIQVISASGKSGTQAGLTFTYTVGEPVITTLSGSRKLTQGFHQPELCMLVSTNDFDLAAWNVEVFPNPTADVLTIRYSAEKGNNLRASVFNLLGQVMLSDQPLTQPDGSQLDCAAWQPGVYILQLQDPATSGVASMRFIRL